jgi:DNA-binding winged helix-turn-helix (wHTH) protein
MLKLSFTHETILIMLENNPGKVVSHRALANRIWKGKLPASWLTMLSQEIRQLRKNRPELRWQLVNVHGRGYILGCSVVHK